MGNICRSPLLEGFARDRLQRVGMDGQVRVASAGTGDWHAGNPPDPRAIQAAWQAGVDISRQRARALSREDFRLFDLMLCADRDNLSEAQRRAPVGSGARLELVTSWCRIEGVPEVPDPYLGNADDFRNVATLAAACADGMLRRLGPQA